MPVVKMPDGTSVRFPDDMPREQIRDMIASKFPDAVPQAAPAPQTAAQPEGRGVFRRVDDAVRGAADMLTFGMSDEISAGLGSLTGIGGEQGGYDANLAAQRERDSQGGVERFGGQVAGALMLPGAAARSIPQAFKQGAAVGGAYGFGSGEGGAIERGKNAAISAGIGGAAGGALRAGANAIGNRAAAKAIPSIDDLRSTSQAGYGAAEAAGVIVRPEGMRKVAIETVDDLAGFGYHPQLQPRIGTILKEMERLGNTNTTYKGLDTLRKMVGQVAASPEPAERAMAVRIIQRLDDYTGNLSPDDVITGNAGQAATGIRQGRENWARMRRAEMVDTAKVKAERRAASTGTGGNLQNALKQNVRGILDSPKRSRGMTSAELAMADNVVGGTKAENALRLVGKLSPTTGGLSAMMNVGAAAVNPALAIPGAVGLGAKMVADRITKRNVERLSQMIRSGGKTGKELANLARGGQMSIPQVKQIEALAKMLGMSVPEMAAATKERITAR